MHAVAARSALDRRYRALNLMEIQGRGSIVVKLDKSCEPVCQMAERITRTDGTFKLAGEKEYFVLGKQ